MQRTVAGLALTLLLPGVGCSGSDAREDEDDAAAVLLITRPEGRDDTTWDTDVGHLRVEAGCILFKGQLAVFPYGTTLVDGATAVRISEDDESIPVDGSAQVRVVGSHVPLLDEGDWNHAMDPVNLDRWSECRRRADLSEYADWWQVGTVELVDPD